MNERIASISREKDNIVVFNEERYTKLNVLYAESTNENFNLAEIIKNMKTQNIELLDQIGELSTTLSKYKKTIGKIQNQNRSMESELQQLKGEQYKDELEIVEVHCIDTKNHYFCKLRNEIFKWYNEDYIINYEQRTSRSKNKI